MHAVFTIMQRMVPVAREQERRVEINQRHILGDQHGRRNREACRDRAAGHDLITFQAGGLALAQGFGQLAGTYG